MSRPQRHLLILGSVVAVLAIAGAASAAVDGTDRANDFDFSENGSNMADADTSGIFGEGTQGFDASSFYNLTRQNLSGLWDGNDTWTVSGHLDTSNATASAADNTVFHVSNVNSAQIAGVRLQAANSDADGDLIVRLNPCGSGGARLDDNSPGQVFHFAVKVEPISSGVWAGLWINGTQVDSTTTSFKPCISNDINYWQVGFRGTDNAAYGGEIHDLRAWDKSLTNSTMQSLATTEEEGSEQAIWTFGDALPFSLSAGLEFDIDGVPEDVATSYHKTENARVFVRTVAGSTQDGGKVLRFDSGLGLQRRITACDGVSLRNTSTPHGLTVSYDNLVAGACKKANDDESVIAIYDDDKMLDHLVFEDPGDGVNSPRWMESTTLNRIVFNDGTWTNFYESDFPKDSVLRRPFGDSVVTSHISIDRDPENNVTWVAGQNPSGTFVASSIGGVTLLENTSVSGANIQLYNRTIWHHDEAEDQIEKYDIVNESALELVRTNSAVDTDAAESIRVSADGGYLLVRDTSGSQDNVKLLDAGNLSELAQLDTADPVDGMAMDRCNNFVYVIAGSGNPNKIQRFDVSGNTSTSAGGNGTSGQNPCPSNPFTADTSGAIEEGKTAVGEEEEGFVAELSTRAADGFGISEEAANWLLGAIFLLGIMMISAMFVARMGGNPSTGATVGIVPGVAFVIGLGLVPLWFLVFVGILGAAVVVVMR